MLETLVLTTGWVSRLRLWSLLARFRAPALTETFGDWSACRQSSRQARRDVEGYYWRADTTAQQSSFAECSGFSYFCARYVTILAAVSAVATMATNIGKVPLKTVLNSGALLGHYAEGVATAAAAKIAVQRAGERE